jgi:hypothetical protein
VFVEIDCLHRLDYTKAFGILRAILIGCPSTLCGALKENAELRLWT